MEPTIPTENWTDLIGAVIVGPVAHGLIILLGKFKSGDGSPFLNEDLLKGLGIGFCFGLMYLFSTWFDPTMTPKMMLMASAAAWGVASGTKLAQSVGTKIVKPTTTP